MTQHPRQWRLWAAAAAACCLLSRPAAQAAWTGPIGATTWRLPAAGDAVRWLEIHERTTAGADALYHVQVLEQGAGDPPWQFRSLADHLALTEAAFRASVIGPSTRKSVYPETYDGAYAQWRKAAAAGKAPVCKSTVTACL